MTSPETLIDPSKDHFENLGFPRSFAVAEDQLEQRFVRMSSVLHPDRSAKDPAAKVRAVLESARLNEAYSVLKDPLRRAEYLLKLVGGRSSAEDKSVPAGFLEETLELRSELEDALGDPDATKRDSIEQSLKLRQSQAIERIAARFQEFESSRKEETLVAIRQELNVAAYLRSMLRDLRESRP